MTEMNPCDQDRFHYIFREATRDYRLAVFYLSPEVMNHILDVFSVIRDSLQELTEEIFHQLSIVFSGDWYQSLVDTFTTVATSEGFQQSPHSFPQKRKQCVARCKCNYLKSQLNTRGYSTKKVYRRRKRT